MSSEYVRAESELNIRKTDRKHRPLSTLLVMNDKRDDHNITPSKHVHGTCEHLSSTSSRLGLGAEGCTVERRSQPKQEDTRTAGENRRIENTHSRFSGVYA